MTEKQSIVDQYDKWYHTFQVFPGVYTKGARPVPGASSFLKRYDLDSLDGKRILDVATFDGGYAFLFEDMNADVVANDIINETETGFHVARKVRGSKMPFVHSSVYELDSENLGEFDLVHFSGIHYHLKNPYLAFTVLNRLLKKDGYIFGHGTGGEYSYVSFCEESDWPAVARFFNSVPCAILLDPKISPYKDPTNWYLFNDIGLDVCLKRSGFQVEQVKSTFNKDLKISYQSFKARKIGEPDPEYWATNHMNILKKSFHGK